MLATIADSVAYARPSLPAAVRATAYSATVDTPTNNQSCSAWVTSTQATPTTANHVATKNAMRRNDCVPGTKSEDRPRSAVWDIANNWTCNAKTTRARLRCTT